MSSSRRTSSAQWSFRIGWVKKADGALPGAGAGFQADGVGGEALRDGERVFAFHGIAFFVFKVGFSVAQKGTFGNLPTGCTWDKKSTWRRIDAMLKNRGVCRQAKPSVPPEKPEIRAPKERFQRPHRLHPLKNQILTEGEHLAGQLVKALLGGLAPQIKLQGIPPQQNRYCPITVVPVPANRHLFQIIGTSVESPERNPAKHSQGWAVGTFKSSSPPAFPPLPSAQTIFGSPQPFVRWYRAS